MPIRNKVDVKVVPGSGTHEPFLNILTSQVGTLTPLFWDYVLPGQKSSIPAAFNVTMPPLAFDAHCRVDYKVEAFFVPLRLLSGGYEKWFAQHPYRMLGGSDVDCYLPALGIRNPNKISDSSEATIAGQWNTKFTKRGSLGDYLGFRCDIDLVKDQVAPGSDEVETRMISMLPFLAYHRLFHDWYRAPLVQREVFLPVDTVQSAGQSHRVACQPYVVNDSSTYLFMPTGTMQANNSIFQLADGKYIYDLRQRNYGFDLFTMATATKQSGQPMAIEVPVANNTGTFTIEAFRSANSLQLFKERNLLAGPRFVDAIRAQYGVTLADGVAQRALLLGSASFPVYSNTVVNDTGAVRGSSTNNPYAGIEGSESGRASCGGKIDLIKNFEAHEPGIIMVIGSLVPEPVYGTGLDKRLEYFCGAGSRVDLANSILQQVGPEAIYEREVAVEQVHAFFREGRIFGYQDRYYPYMEMVRQSHGLVSPQGAFSAMIPWRVFAPLSYQQVQINSDFLEIKPYALDNITGVTAQLSQYGYQLDSFFDYRSRKPLKAYSRPTLEDPAYEHGKTVTVDRGGTSIR